jgi:UDP-N-acetylmuramoylalanine--D-glutamate ligase
VSQRVAVIGAGESGTGAARLAKSRGDSVFVSDYGSIAPAFKKRLSHAGIEFEEGGHTEAQLLEADVWVKSPGISYQLPLIGKAQEQGIQVIDEIEYAAQWTQADLIGITGTNGKTTTATLTHHILKHGGMDVRLAGNVGQSMAAQLEDSEPEAFVLELSSFQLEGMFKTRLKAAALLNITPDHLDRHGTLEEYIRCKYKITQNQEKDDVFVYGADNELVAGHLAQRLGSAQTIPFQWNQPSDSFGAWVNDQEFIVQLHQNQHFKMSINQLTISGRHNVYNSMAAAVIANSLNINKSLIRESLSDFRNVEHRLEFVARVKGIEFINDSKATNVNAAWYALESMDKPVIWIAGGVDKGNQYESLSPLVKEKVRFIICLGKDNRKIHEAFGKQVEMIYNTSSAREAVRVAYSLARKGEAVLLSPACASFDLFENYEDRGNQFKKAVKTL